MLGGGGRYDELMGRFGRPLPAAGFALYLERLHVAQAEEERCEACEGDGRRRSSAPDAGGRATDPRRIRRLLSSRCRAGRCSRRRSTCSTAIGIDTAELRGDSRSLVFEAGELRLVTMRPSDVPTYVEAGAADLGITGKDVLAEQRDRAVYELARPRLRRLPDGARRPPRRRAPRASPSAGSGAMRIATKYPRTAERYFEHTGRQAEVIEVKGSVELAPLVGLADGIVDLVDTGRTLAENDLEVREEIAVCTARLVANRVAHKLRAGEIDALAERLREAAR